MKTVYKTKNGKAAVLQLYDIQLSKLGCGYHMHILTEKEQDMVIQFLK